MTKERTRIENIYIFFNHFSYYIYNLMIQYPLIQGTWGWEGQGSDSRHMSSIVIEMETKPVIVKLHTTKMYIPDQFYWNLSDNMQALVHIVRKEWMKVGWQGYASWCCYWTVLEYQRREDLQGCVDSSKWSKCCIPPAEEVFRGVDKTKKIYILYKQCKAFSYILFVDIPLQIK